MLCELKRLVEGRDLGVYENCSEEKKGCPEVKVMQYFPNRRPSVNLLLIPIINNLISENVENTINRLKNKCDAECTLNF